MVMTVILLCVAMMIASGYIFEENIEKKRKGTDRMFYISVAVCLVIKLICACLYYGHSTDMGCFSAWSEMAFKNGISKFYTSDTFTDYPPGYMYVLYVLGALKSLFGLSGAAYAVILKLPAILADILTGILIYRCAVEKIGSGNARYLALLYMLNPAVIVNSSLWGQVDGVYTVLICIVILMIMNKSIISSFFVFAVCIFIKPQSLIYTPVILFAVFEELDRYEFDIKLFFKYLIGAVGAVGLMAVLALPFGIINVLQQYVKTLASYPYMTINAFNFWGALGQNWVSLTGAVSAVGTIFIVLIVAFSGFIFFGTKDESRYFKTGAFLAFATYMLSTKMHDRYAFPVMAMLAFAYVFNKDRRVFRLFTLTSASQLFNMAWVLFIYEKDINFYAHSPVIAVASAINIALLIYFISVMRVPMLCISEADEMRCKNMKRTDWIVILCITAVYSCFALYDLGDMRAPKTHIKVSEPVRVEFSTPQTVSDILYYPGADTIEKDNISIALFDESGEEVLRRNVEDGSVFYWNEESAGVIASGAEFSVSDDIDIFEIGFKNNGKKIEIADCNYPELIDEQELIPDRPTFRNGTYFDEIYHARTGYEFVDGDTVYEWTHPPLGKVFIDAGIRIF